MYTTNPPNVTPGYPYYRSSNRPESDFQRERDDLKIFILPAWIYRAFSRHHSLADIHDYSKLRQTASLQDIATLTVTNSYLCEESEVRAGSVHQVATTGSFFKLYEQGYADNLDIPCLTDDEYSEYKASVTFYEKDESFRRTVMARYRDSDDLGNAVCSDLDIAFVPGVDPGKDPKSLGYRIEYLKGSLYIIVEEGFLSRIAGKAARLTFFQQVLKAAYAALPISTVNRSVWYRNYVHALQKAGE